MNPLRSMAWAAVALRGCAAARLPAVAQRLREAAAQIRFSYENPKLQPPKYVLTVSEDGTGHFRSEGGGPASTDAESMPAEPQDRPIHISKALREAMFADRAQKQTLRLCLR